MPDKVVTCINWLCLSVLVSLLISSVWVGLTPFIAKALLSLLLFWSAVILAKMLTDNTC